MRTQTHDPYRSQQIDLPRISDTPYDGPIVVHAHVDRYPPMVNAGAEWMLHAMLRWLVDDGIEVHVTTGCVATPVDVDGVQVWPAAAASTIASGADVLVGHLLWTREVVTLAHRQRLPLIYITHNDFQVRYWRLGPSDVSAIVQNAQWIQERHDEQFPNWDGPSIVVRPPCRMADYHVARPDPEYITLVNPNPDKGADVFHEVARRMKDRRFLAVGGAYGLQQHPPKGVKNVRYQSPTGDIANDVYARTRILMVPSKYESWGRVAVEAFCSGIPVLAQPTPGLLESCGEAAIFCDRDDPDSWVEAIEALDDSEAYDARSALSLERAILLDAGADRDLAGWTRLVRCAAGASVAART